MGYSIYLLVGVVLTLIPLCSWFSPIAPRADAGGMWGCVGKNDWMDESHSDCLLKKKSQKTKGYNEQ